MKNVFLTLLITFSTFIAISQEQPFELMADAPDFSIVEKGKDVLLSEMVKDGPVVLTFYRGVWCKYCNQFLTELSDNMDRYRKLDAKVYAISPEKGKYVDMMDEDIEANFSLMGDNERSIIDLYNLSYKLSPKKIKQFKNDGIDILKHNGENNAYLPVPATFIIDRNMKIRFIQYDEDYTYRADLDEVFRVLRSLSGERLIELDIKLLAQQHAEKEAKKAAEQKAKRAAKLKARKEKNKIKQ